MSREILTSFSAQLNELTAPAEGSRSDGDCESRAETPLSSMSCDDLTRSIQCGFVRLQHELGNGLRDATALSEKVARIDQLSALVAELRERETSTRDVAEREARQDNERRFSDLTDRLQRLGKDLTDANEASENDKVTICVLEINAGHFKNASDALKSIRDPDRSRIRRIIETSYREKGVYSVALFLRSLRSCDWDEIAYPVLYDAIDPNSPEDLLVVSAGVNACAAASDLAAKVGADLNRIFDDRLAPDGRRNGFDRAVEFASKYDFDVWGDHAIALVDKSYTGADDATNIVRFMRKIPFSCSIVGCLRALYERLKDVRYGGTAMTMLGQYAESLDDVPKATRCRSFGDTVTEIKRRIPGQLLRLVEQRGRSCRLKNEAYEESLYVGSAAFQQDKQSRRVFTRKSSEAGRKVYWTVESSVEFADGFRIKNTAYDEYLLPPPALEPDGDTLGWSFLSGVSCRPDSRIADKESSRWEINADAGDGFKIAMAKDHNYLLCASNDLFDYEKRHVNVRRVVNPTPKCLWKIQCD